MAQCDDGLRTRLGDARSNEVILVSHCMLDENVRYLGGAFHSGAAPETVQLVARGVGICQMPCPEVRAWGGVRKSRMLRAYGLRDTRLYRYRRPLFRLFTWYTRMRYRRLARHVVREIEEYRKGGVEVIGVIGVGASPSCGVLTTLDLHRSFETVAACPLARIDRNLINERAVAGCRVPGEGMFITAVRKRLKRRGIEVPMIEYDLIAEMRGADQRLDLNRPAAGNVAGGHERRRSRR